jgi:integrase
MKIKISKDKRNKASPWVVRWSMGPDPVTAKEKWHARAFKYKSQAESFKAELLTDKAKEAQERKPTNGITLKSFCREWLKTRRPELRPQTLKVYDNTIARLSAYFGPGFRLSEITPMMAAKFIAAQKRMDDKADELSAWSRHRTLRNCKTMFETALEWEKIDKNPFGKMKRPKLPKQRWHYMTPDEFIKLLRAEKLKSRSKKKKWTVPLRQKVIYALAYCCGLRLGEILNLMWADVDFEKAEIRIEDRPATTTRPPFAVKDKEARRVPVPKLCLNLLVDLKTYNKATDQTPYIALDEGQYSTVLAKWKKYQEQERDDWANRDMQNNTLVTFKRHLRWSGIKPDGSLALHTLRKSCITNWANAINNPEVVRQLAGHADLKTTMQYYSYVSEQQQRNAAQAIDKLLPDEQKYVFGAYEGDQD